MVDYRYICGRDNYSCVYTGVDLTEGIMSRHGPGSHRSQPYLRKVAQDKDWCNSNVVLVAPEAWGADPIKRLSKPNLPALAVPGRLIMVVGSMFSEKTWTTRSLLNNYGYALGKYLWIKPDRDDRGAGVTSHNKDETEEMANALCISARRPDKHMDMLVSYPIVAIDEVQFFADRILYVIHQLLKAGRIVIVNGLKLDYKRDLFGMTHYLLAEADEIIFCKAVCSKCKTIETATRTKKYSMGGPSVEPGGSRVYYVVCPNCDKE